MPPPDPSVALHEPIPVSIGERIRLLVRVWRLTLETYGLLRRYPLPAVVEQLAMGPDERTAGAPVGLLSRAVSRGLRIGPWRPRCLVRSLVLFRMLQAQGRRPVLVIGMKDRATTTDAHAWVELDGRDVGPWPGGGGYRELARYSGSGAPEPPR